MREPIKRWTFVLEEDSDLNVFADAHQCKDGDYVLYTDHSARVAELEGRVAMLREALWVAVEHCALYHGETINVVVDGRKALTATESTAAEYRKQIENEALERAAMKFEDFGYRRTADDLRNMKKG